MSILFFLGFGLAIVMMRKENTNVGWIFPIKRATQETNSHSCLRR